MRSSFLCAVSTFGWMKKTYEISEKTVVEVGPFNEGITTKDLEENKNQILRKLRKKAYGILMNFVSAEDFDFQSALPKFKNGMYEEETQKSAGSTSGSICENIRVEAIVFHPDERKVKRLLKERLSVLNINAITFGFVVPETENESLMTIGKRCLRKIQEEYIILSYDNTEGAKVEIADDFYLSFMVSEHVIKIRLSTKYEFQFEKRMKDFSVIAFLEKLLMDEQEWIKEDTSGADAPGDE